MTRATEALREGPTVLSDVSVDNRRHKQRLRPPSHYRRKVLLLVSVQMGRTTRVGETPPFQCRRQGRRGPHTLVAPGWYSPSWTRVSGVSVGVRTTEAGPTQPVPPGHLPFPDGTPTAQETPWTPRLPGPTYSGSPGTKLTCGDSVSDGSVPPPRSPGRRTGNAGTDGTRRRESERTCDQTSEVHTPPHRPRPGPGVLDRSEPGLISGPGPHRHHHPRPETHSPSPRPEYNVKGDLFVGVKLTTETRKIFNVYIGQRVCSRVVRLHQQGRPGHLPPVGRVTLTPRPPEPSPPNHDVKTPRRDNSVGSL